MSRRGLPAAFAPLLVLLLLAPAGFAAPAEITVDGEGNPLVCLPVSGAPNRPQPGDVVEVRDVGIRLDGTFALEFRTEREGYWLRKIFVGQPPRLVAIEAEETRDGNPFAGLSEEEIRGLRGVSLEALTPEIATDLLRIDPARCCVSLRFTDRLPELPALPADLECLRLSTRGPRSIDLSGLAKLTRLTLLDARWAPDFPLELLQKLPELRTLTVDLGEGQDPSPGSAVSTCPGGGRCPPSWPSSSPSARS